MYPFTFSQTKICTFSQTQAVDDQPKSGLYEHPIIQKSINALFFKNRLDIGVEFTDAFQPFPHVALALVFAAVSFVSMFMSYH